MALILLSIGLSAQVDLQRTTTVETGLLGLFVNHDLPISSRDIIRMEVGLDATIYGGSQYTYDVGYILTPKIGVEYRRYYERQRRQNGGKSIDRNAGNFFAVIADYHPPIGSIRIDEEVLPSKRLEIIPSWGIRRTWSKRWSAEAGIGFGYAYRIDIPERLESDHTVHADLRLRIGYMLWQ